MKRKDIAEKYKWNLGLVLSGKEEFYLKCEEIKRDAKTLSFYEGKLTTKEAIFDFIKKDGEMDKKLGRVYLYAMLRVNADNSDPEALTFMDVVTNLSVEISMLLAFVSPELSNLSDEFLVSLMNDLEHPECKRLFEEIIRQKPHTLTTNEEKLLAGIGAFSDFDNTFSMLDNVEIKFDDVLDSLGKPHKLTNASYGLLMRSSDKVLRANTQDRKSVV